MVTGPLNLPDEAATEQLGEDIAMVLRRGDTLCLHGELGAGKSCLARALIRALADNVAMEVPSPTYTLCQTYEGALPVSHFDLYRLGSADEVIELGLEEAVEQGAVIVEWPERASAYMPGDALHLHLSVTADGGRQARFSQAGTAFGMRVSRSLAIRAFLDKSQGSGVVRRRFQGDASARRYETATIGTTMHVVMDAPRLPDGPPIRDGKPYSQIVHLAEDVTPFVAIAELLASKGYAAPPVHARSLSEGLLLIGYLGDGKIVDERKVPIAERYCESARLLAKMHGEEWTNPVDVATGNGETRLHRIAAYDSDAISTEASLFADWYAPRFGNRLEPAARNSFLKIWEELAGIVSTGETSLVLRDYHSPNIIWRQGEPFPARIGLIDFQDALIGPAAYDVASLAQDARVDVPAALEMEIIGTYLAERSRHQAFDPENFRRDYAIMAAQRATKILGIFVRLDERDGKPEYLAHLPRVRDYLRRNLAHPVLAGYRDWCAMHAGLDQAATATD